ncbi:MAG TPA: carbonic anhydrase [Candidatus Ozemobacteraceae bacterium]|nr:carbonic anhydrase [Candidatus Ozemobacteraceae bacterium]HQG27096.1 carbonic anhydrase [Candidatus Ozemobacteraceae bacterium]
MKYRIYLTVLLSFAASAAFCSSPGHGQTSVGWDTARLKLMSGNKRFVESRMRHSGHTARRRIEIAKGQHPFAVVVCCSDSRVPPEILFDQGLGDLFVIRLAGNIVDDAAIGSIEYAVEHLNVSYVMVLGHERCGAVEATVKGGHYPGCVGTLAKAIRPAMIDAARQSGDFVENTVRANVALVVRTLRSAGPILEERFRNGLLSIEGARYDLDDGTVEMLP